MLRVVQTQAILCSKSISERGGSDIDRLWNLMTNFFDSKSTEDYVIKSRSMSDPPLSDIDLKINWLRSGLPLKTRLSRFNETSILDNKNNTFYHVVKQRFHYFDILGEDFDDETSSLADNFRPGRDIFYSSKGWSILYGPYNLGFILENNFASSRELQNRSWRQPVWSTKSSRWIWNKLCLHEKCF